MARRSRAAKREQLTVKNGTALLAAVLGGIVAIVGLVLQVRQWQTPLRWVETTCIVAERGEDPDVALPRLRSTAAFRCKGMPRPGVVAPCASRWTTLVRARCHE